MFTEYGEKELEYLKKKDKKMADIIEKVGYIECIGYKDLFEALIYSIVGQQISLRAHEAIYGRMLALIKEVTPKNILKCDENDLRKCGISYRKINYIKNISDLTVKEEFNIKKLYEMSDEDVLKNLIELNGVGAWTAEMLMMFAMARKNILSYNDLIIRRGLCTIYHHKKIDKKLFEKYKKRFSPYNSIASLYIWKVGNGKVEGYSPS